MQKDNLKDKYYIKNGIDKTINTVSIGALRAFEEQFGYLWGIHLKEEERTDEHRIFEKMWISVRKKILEQAEDSKDILSKNIDKFNITRKKVFVRF